MLNVDTFINCHPSCFYWGSSRYIIRSLHSYQYGSTVKIIKALWLDWPNNSSGKLSSVLQLSGFFILLICQSGILKNLNWLIIFLLFHWFEDHRSAVHLSRELCFRRKWNPSSSVSLWWLIITRWVIWIITGSLWLRLDCKWTEARGACC